MDSSWFHGWKSQPFASRAVTVEFVPLPAFLLSCFQSTLLFGFLVSNLNLEARKPGRQK